MRRLNQHLARHRDRWVDSGWACVAVTLALLPVACSNDATPHTTVRDSAGVAIIENLDAAPLTWTLELEPSVVIGADADDTLQALYNVGGVARLGDGRIVLTDGGTSQIRVFSPTGEYRSAVGRNGEGPGEFRSVSRPYRVAGDSVLIYDASLRRISIFDDRLRFSREFRLRQEAGGDAVSPALVLGGTDILARPGFSFGSNTPDGLYQDSVGYQRFGMDGSFIDSVGRFAGTRNLVLNDGGNSIAASLPFWPQPRIAATADGFVFGPAERFEIGQYGRDGRLLALIRVPVRVLPFTAELKQKFRDDLLGSASQDQRQFFERLLAAIRMPDVLPAYSRLIVDTEGRLWVRDFAWEDQESVTWHVFMPDGVLAATVEMPARLEVHEIGPDWVLGIWLDDLGIETVRLHRLASVR